MKLSKQNQKTFLVRIVSQVILPLVEDKAQRFAIGAVVGAADCPFADRVIDTLTKNYYETAQSIGIMDESGALDVSVAEAALRGAFATVPEIFIDDFNPPPWALKIFKGVGLDTSDVDTIVNIAKNLADNAPMTPHTTTHNEG